MSYEEIKWTKSFVESFNERAEAIGFPILIVSDGMSTKMNCTNF